MDFRRRELSQNSHQKFLVSKTLRQIFAYSFLYLRILQDIAKSWMVKFGEPLVIFRIRKGFPVAKIQVFTIHFQWGSQ